MDHQSRFATQEDQLEELQEHWIWFLILGIALIILGIFAIGHSAISTFAVVKVTGLVLLLTGVVQVVTAFWAPKWSGLLIQVLFGILYVVVGAMLIRQPEKGAALITLMMAVFFVVGGIFRIVLALDMRFHNWGWVLFNGIITLLLGMMIWSEWPEISVMVIGIFVGIEILICGWVWTMMALSVRSLTTASGGDSGKKKK